ncbi:MAG TPA: O-antigen ligase family protein [Gaiellaceae bacterium]|nr:O-antigen ligase family protein [Gaiellaceae bacterium]
MSRLEAPERGRDAAVMLLGLGALALLGGIALGPEAAVGGAAVLVGASVLAMRELATPTITWPNAVAGFVLLMWLIPARGYRLPVTLPFNLELYRLALVLLVLALVLALANRTTTLDFGGRGAPIALMAVAGIAAAILNDGRVGVAGEAGPIKALTFFLGFYAVFVLVMSTIRTREGVDTVLRAFVVGAAVVGLSAAYESRVGYNLFDHLHEYVPVLVREARADFTGRGGLDRVYASSQHPIALACALVLAFPLSLYLSRRARSLLRSRLWLAAGAACAIGAAATVSRTSVIMVLAMVLFAVFLRPREVIRYWPLLLVVPVVIKFAVPGALGGIWKAFFPEQGLLASDLYSRQGEGGSGRFADIGPGFTLWSQAPFLGHGLGFTPTTGTAQAAQTAEGAEGAIIYFDNQLLSTLVSVGLIGLLATLWFVWGSLVAVAGAARRTAGELGDLLAMFAISIVGFAVGMVLFDSFAFVQVTIFYFVIVALALRARTLAAPPDG